jgi:hypothetical protein
MENLNYPAFPTDNYKRYDYVYVKDDSLDNFYKYGGVALIIEVPDNYSGYELEGCDMCKFHVEEDKIIREATKEEIKRYRKKVDFELELRYIDNSM